MQTSHRADPQPASASADGSHGRWRVAFVLTQDKGGPVDVTVALARKLDELGHTVRLFAPRPARNGDLVEHLLTEIRVPSKTDVRAMRAVRRRLLDFAPDVVHAQDRRAGLLCAGLGRAGRPRPLLVHTYHGVPEDVTMPWLTRRQPPRPSRYTLATLAADAVVARLVDHTITVAPMMRDFLVERLRVPASRVTHLDNGLWLGPAEPVTGSTRLIYVGLLIPRKGVDVLLRAVARVRAQDLPVELTVVGDGPEADSLRALSRELGVEPAVHFLGFRSDVDAQLARHDVFCLPSHMEQQPLVLIEALAAGRLVVATDAGGVADMLAGLAPGAVVVPPGEVDAFAAAVTGLQALADPAATSTQLIRAARERFSIETCAANHLALYTELDSR